MVSSRYWQWAYKVVDEAVEIFMDVFYQSLLIKGVSVQDAARMSRLALMKSRSRRARYMQYVQLSDYIVPVPYTSCPKRDPAGTLIDLKPRGTVFSYLEKVLTSINHVSPTKREAGDTMIPVRQELIGRDSDILSLELPLSVSRVILLHGQGGCGKSELLRYVCRWWKASGWIRGSAYVDFADHEGYSLEDFVDEIGNQLGIDPENRSEAELIGKLKSGKYLLVFDSADALDTPILVASVITAEELPTQLKSFIDAATHDGSMVIVSARLDTAQIANITSERQKYHLTGSQSSTLWIFFSKWVNLDFLRRVAILVEGNPAAIQMIVPALRRANHDSETLLNMLLYGVCETNDDQWKRCRFVRSIYGAMFAQSFINVKETLIHVKQFAMFWTLMPQDLIYYYWFLYLPYSKHFQEGSFAIWISQEFQEIVEKAQMVRTLRKYWLGIEMKLLRAGILENAVIKRYNGERIACYHVHPIFTLIGRSGLKEQALKEAKFAYVRQALLWDRPRARSYSKEVVSVEWDGAEQHEDYWHNTRAVAMAWSLEDGDLQEEVERMGVSLFDCAYKMSLNSLYVNQRQPRLFIPLIWRHLLRVHLLTTLVRPGGVPTSSDLHTILSYSWALCRLETDSNRKISLVSMALEAAKRCRAANPAETVLTPPDELSWFQLRHAEADIAQSNSTIYKAKELYERNLADDPSSSDKPVYNAIRRWQLQNLTNWAGCVVQIAAREGTLDKEQVTTNLRAVCGEFKPRGIVPFVLNMCTENEKIIETVTVRQQFLFAVEQEKDAVTKFGTLAKRILDAPLVDIFADLAETQNLPPGGIFAFCLRQMLETDNPRGVEMRALFGNIESGLHMLSGDRSAAASALGFSVQREALSSTASTGWKNLANLHMHMYALAVTQNDRPDYKKGLTHLEEWWKQHRGIDVAKRYLCYGHLKFATCYNGLNRVAEAARAVIKCAQIVPTVAIADCADGDSVEGFSEWLHEQFTPLDKLDIFLDPRVVFSAPASVAELSWQERVVLHQIMKKAQEAKKMTEDCDKAMDEMTER
ncbi:hypothetical protein H2199_000028 [Coniosporium tulheliwenetii]|uniref:Uncharacterized protein n=1 Tax=Coniosporium tulheliwenetii TaxID=3383036 RepID=A0ACC2ZPD9_9PEZI|nr:hypothetical protein H2199_000028 [Cladosporium sp. JES 115]